MKKESKEDKEGPISTPGGDFAYVNQSFDNIEEKGTETQGVVQDLNAIWSMK